MIDRDVALESHGVTGGTNLHTPGHLPGSVSAVFPNGDVLAADLVIGGISFLGGIARLGHARKPPFEDDAEAVRKSLTDLLDQGASRFFVGHGGPLTERRSDDTSPTSPASAHVELRRRASSSRARA